MEKKYAFGLIIASAVVIMIAFVLLTGTASADSPLRNLGKTGMFNNGNKMMGPGGHELIQNNETVEMQKAMQTAIEYNDYDAWKEVMQERVAFMQSQITEDNFNSMVESHNEMNDLIASGNFTRTRFQRQGNLTRMPRGDREGRFERPCAMDDASAS